MPKTRGALYRIPEELKLAIAEYVLANPDKTREALAGELTDQLTKRSEENPVYTPPQWYTLLKMISTIRNTVLNGLDSPWHMGTLDKYPLPQDAIPGIFAVQKYVDSVNTAEHVELWGALEQVSVRQAKWIARFAPFYKGSLRRDDIGGLWRLSHVYAYREIVSQLAGQEMFDTAEYDARLRRGESLDSVVEADTTSWLEENGKATLSYRAMQKMGRGQPKTDAASFLKLLTEVGMKDTFIEARKKAWREDWAEATGGMPVTDSEILLVLEFEQVQKRGDAAVQEWAEQHPAFADLQGRVIKWRAEHEQG